MPRLLRNGALRIAALFVAASASTLNQSGSSFEGEDSLVLLQTSAKTSPSSRDNPSNAEQPRMLVMDGCSGSSFIMNVAMKLMKLHGFKIAFFGDSEMMKPEKNAFFTEKDGIGVAMEKANADAHRREGTLAFQLMTGMLTREDADPSAAWDGAAPHLEKLGTYAVYARRANVLDHAVCTVRDCFDSTIGIPVDEAGQKSNLCFARRSSTAEAENYKAQLIPDKLLEMMKKTEQDWDVEQEVLKKTFKKFNSVTMEDLLAYQYDKLGLATSTKAWVHYMDSWGVKANSKAIKKFLSEDVGQKAAPGPHSESIYNIDEIRTELKNQHMDHFLREAGSQGQQDTSGSIFARPEDSPTREEATSTATVASGFQQPVIPSTL